LSERSIIAREVRDEKDGADAEPAGEVASRGRINLRATASKLYVTESRTLRRYELARDMIILLL